ncbi:MAG: helix-turn-helix domain-containing protein [Gemmataceae bacterium]
MPPSLDVDELETWAIRRALRQTAGNVSRAAQVLGMSRDTLHTKLKKKGIDREELAAEVAAAAEYTSRSWKMFRADRLPGSLYGGPAKRAKCLFFAGRALWVIPPTTSAGALGGHTSARTFAWPCRSQHSPPRRRCR